MFTKSVVISLLSAIAYALPSGSPYCQINNSNMAVFERNHSPQSSKTGFSAEFTPENGSYRIRLSKKDVPIHGVLLYVTGTDKSTHLGRFTTKPGFKFVQGCTGGKESTITHGNGREKMDTEFIWTPASNEKGPFTLNAVVSGDQNPWSMFKVQEAPKVAAAQSIEREANKEISAVPKMKTNPYENLPYFGDSKAKKIQPNATDSLESIYLNGDEKRPVVLMIAFSFLAFLA